MKRMRGRNHRHGGGGGSSGGGGGGGYRHAGQQPMNRNHVFDSNGPDMRLRGTAQQLFEKYLQLGRDATGSGDRVTAEGYFQHAEHYFRILNAMSQVQSGPPPQHRRFQSVSEGPDGPDGVGDQPDTSNQANGAAQANGAHVNGHASGSDAEDDAPSADSREPA